MSARPPYVPPTSMADVGAWLVAKAVEGRAAYFTATIHGPAGLVLHCRSTEVVWPRYPSMALAIELGHLPNSLIIHKEGVREAHAALALVHWYTAWEYVRRYNLHEVGPGTPTAVYDPACAEGTPPRWVPYPPSAGEEVIARVAEAAKPSSEALVGADPMPSTTHCDRCHGPGAQPRYTPAYRSGRLYRGYFCDACQPCTNCGALPGMVSGPDGLCPACVEQRVPHWGPPISRPPDSPEPTNLMCGPDNCSGCGGGNATARYTPDPAQVPTGQQYMGHYCNLCVLSLGHRLAGG